jgi:hypothetical protein
MTVPGGLAGSSPSYTFVLPTGGAATLTFTATDPEGDPMLWQLGVPGGPANAAGLTFSTPVTGPTFELQVGAVTAPAAAPVTLLVEDPRGAAAAIDVLFVRSGAPVITGVSPDSSFQSLPQRVTVTGGGLQLGGFVNTSVAFDGFAVTQSSIQVQNDSSLSCLTPVAVQPGPTVVAVGNQFGNASLPDTEFTVLTFPPVFGATDEAVAAANSFDVANEGSALYVLWAGQAASLTPASYRTSLDGGATWSQIFAFDDPGVASEPRVAANGTDAVAVWIGDGQRVLYSQFTASSNPPASSLALTSQLVQRQRPRVCRDGDRVFASWLEGDPLASLQRVVVTSSGDGGTTWSPPQKISDVANQDNHDIRCLGDTAWVVMEDERLGPSVRGVYVVRTTDAGANWGVARRLNSPGSSASSPRACDAGGRAHVAWLQNDALLYLSSTDNGATWGNNITTVQDATAGAVTAPAIACDAQRVVFGYVIGGTAVWSARVPTPNAPVQRTQVDSLVTASSDVRVDLAGDYGYVTWIEGSGPAARVRVAVSGNATATFASNESFGDGTGQQRSPALAYDGSRLFVAWLDDRAATTGLFTNRNQ